MKAYRRLQNTGKGRFGGHPIRLTVAMIVKNEEKTLDKCLSSLKPLLEAVPSELIITDTGSTDNTVEIAEKYTDKIIHFEWCGDFSAARNTGINAAKGQWFMFIDGDEWFESTDEIISFFNSGECDKYGSASYIQRNYTKPGNDKIYSDFHALRIFRFYPGMHFNGIIHESISWAKPLKILNDYAHHYGYAYKDKKEMMDKAKRNITLLKKTIDSDQLNLKAYYQIGKEYLVLNDFDTSIDYSKKALAIEREHRNKIWQMSIMRNLIMSYFEPKKYKELLEVSSAFFKENPKPEVIYLDFLYCAHASAFALKRFAEAACTGEKYLDIYRKYKAGKLDESMLVFSDFTFITPESRQRLLVTLGWSYLLQNDPALNEKAISLINEFDLTQPLNNNIYSVLFAIADASGKWELISSVYNKLFLINNTENISAFIKFTEQYIAKDSKSANDVITAVSAVNCEDAYVYLNRLRSAELCGKHDAVLSALEWFAKNNKIWDDRLSDVIYFAMKEKINIMPYIIKIDTDDFKYFISNIQRAHKDFTETVINYFNIYSFENLKGLYFTVVVKEKVILSENDLNDDEYISFFENYASETARYVRMIFRRETFLPLNIPALPRAYRFGYYIGEAFEDRKRIDEKGYLKNLRLALEAYPVMKKPISILLDQVEEDIKGKNEKATEFVLLAGKIKMQIENLIKSGDLKQAGSITEQLAKLMPNDADVIRYRKITDTEPTMAELASNLPQ